MVKREAQRESGVPSAAAAPRPQAGVPDENDDEGCGSWPEYPAPLNLIQAVAAFVHLSEVADEEERGAVPPPPLWPMCLHAAVPDPIGHVTKNTPPTEVDPSFIPLATAYLSYTLRRWRQQGALVIRKSLSVDDAPPIDAVIEAGAIAPLTRLTTIEYDDEPATQFEALWALTNVASGTAEHTATVVGAGVVPLVVRLLWSANANVAEQAVWMLGNISGDSAQLRDTVLAAGAVPGMIALVTDAKRPIGVTRNAAWALSNCVRSKPPPQLHALGKAGACFAEALAVQDEEVRVDALWGLSYYTDISDEARDEILKIDGIMPKVFAQMQQGDTLLTPALRIVGNYCSGTAEQTKAATEQGLMTAMPFLLTHHKRNVVKEALWTLSNVLADEPKYVSLCLASNVWPHVLNLLGSGIPEHRKEAAWCVANGAHGGSPVDIAGMIAAGTVPAIAPMIDGRNPKVVSVLLEAVQHMLTADKDGVLAADAANGDALLSAIKELADNEDAVEDLQEQAQDLLDGLDAGGSATPAEAS